MSHAIPDPGFLVSRHLFMQLFINLNVYVPTRKKKARLKGII